MYDLSVNMWKSCSIFSITKYNDLGQASDDKASRLHSWQYHVPQKSTRINGSEAWYDLLHGPPAEYVEWSPWSVVEGYRTLGQKGNKGLGDSLVYGVLDRVSKLSGPFIQTCLHFALFLEQMRLQNIEFIWPPSIWWVATAPASKRIAATHCNPSDRSPNMANAEEETFKKISLTSTGDLLAFGDTNVVGTWDATT